MSVSPPGRPLFVVVYPYNVTDFHRGLFELDEFAPHCDTLVLDVAQLVAPEFARRVGTARSTHADVRAVARWRDLWRELMALRRRSLGATVCLQNVVPHSLARGLACNLLMAFALRGRDARMFDLFISGTPVYSPAASTGREAGKRESPWLRRFRQLTTFSEAAKKIAAIGFRALSRVLPSAMTHRLVAGSDWETLALASAPRAGRVKIVRAHSHDYSRALLSGDLEKFRGPMGSSAVLLDAAGPMFGDDYAFMGRKSFLTAEAWYPALSAFFDRLESTFGVRVEIAGHPKSKHPAVAPHFGQRNVHYGRTLEQARASRFVITRQSAAVAYAVMFRKPVVFLSSNQIELDLRAIHGIRHLASLFGKVPVNIDVPPTSLDGLLDVDERRYREFEQACLTSDPARRPNFQIILEDIMNIPTRRATAASQP